MQVKKKTEVDMEQWTGSKLSPCLFNLYAEYIMQNAGLDEAQAGFPISRRNIKEMIKEKKSMALTREIKQQVVILEKGKTQ